jgi:predicted protein tyrosine phosphatase
MLRHAIIHLLEIIQQEVHLLLEIHHQLEVHLHPHQEDHQTHQVEAEVVQNVKVNKIINIYIYKNHNYGQI